MTDPSLKRTRRSFLNHVLIGWAGLILLPTLYGIVRYIIPPRLFERVSKFMVAGRFGDIPPMSQGAKIVKFNKKAVILFRNEANQIRALSAVCTHLGCIVQYQVDQKQFKCNCHGSVFDITGRNIAGPAPKPLAPFRVELKDDNVVISES